MEANGPDLTLGEALDAPNLRWISVGLDAWSGQASVTRDGRDAAQSGPIGHGEGSPLQTVITGPASVSFHWKVSSESNRDWLKVFVDDVEHGRISGEIDWQAHTITVPTGVHIITWYYSKDGLGSNGQDCGWINEVNVIAEASADVVGHRVP